jgi:GntR family transcriptional regulator
MFRIEVESGIPLYIQLKDILREKILKGDYKPQDRIPPENELCVLFGVSRITVRQALGVLAQEKLLLRKQGKGTFVTSPMFGRRLPKLDSFSETMRELGLTPSSRVVERRIEIANEDVAALLKLPPKQQRVNKMVRVRLANGEPVLLEQTYVPYFLCPSLLEEDPRAASRFETASLYAYLTETCGLVLHTARETFEVTSLKKREAELLGCVRTQPAFAIERIAFLGDGTPVELTRSRGRGDRVRLTLQLVSDAARLLPKIELLGRARRAQQRD